MKKYKIIYADPPWAYRDLHMINSSVIDHYSVMNQENIKNLPVGGVADKDCALFLWVTMPKLNEVFDVIKAWGFEYKTCAFTWVKLNKKADTYFMGQGRWTRANAELCLLATKGSPKKISCAIRSLVVSHYESHSKKPKEVRDRIIQLLGDLPRIELFARQKTAGWDVWGNEVESDIDLLANTKENNPNHRGKK